MKWIIVGLGNPGQSYKETRHNTGQLILEALRHAHDLPPFESSKTHHALISKGELMGKKAVLVAPETYMNESGKSVAKLVKSHKQAERLVLIHDDIDLPIGEWKFSQKRGSGGHKGVESIERSIKTRDFIRVRVGVQQISSSGESKKPNGKDAVADFVLGKFSTKEREIIKHVSAEVVSALDVLLAEGIAAAMNKYN